ncbi:mechanosensitive ion channel family protein [Conexibacter sp. CPCC 206217]|uniref:mechanosensitive ion channel family protein n=1 Tax=Conexibacter sp. CPCC 206217 TaxID=3064574 RepID=UPI0027195647|nr:mechanosensitive ion channel family protein [Conexibacter sp. CPCC 206217]MDO8211511.1 mechanosensitive ion channel family protein [Conexibacter sp. CPCC 206217]
MVAADVVIPFVSAASSDGFLGEHRWAAAILSLLIAVVVAWVVDRAIFHRGKRFAEAVMRDDLTSEVDTRMRFLRRLTTLVILVIGAMTALAQFDALSQLATTVLASSALLAAVIGFAARQTLANLIAGVMLTIAQPLRIGDSVAIEEESGTVEDVRLNYTVVRGGDGHRVFIPNERLASGVLRNDSIVEPQIDLEVDLWLPLALDADAVLDALARIEGTPVARIGEVASEGVRYTLSRGTVGPRERPLHASALRADALRALRERGLLSELAAS